MAGVEVRAVARDIRVSPQKVRLVLETIRGKAFNDAIATLRYLPQKGARPVSKVLRSAAANAENNFNMDPELLMVTGASADAGRTLKRWRPRARGRVNQILKRSSHITVIVAERE